VEIDQEYQIVRIDGDEDPLKEHPQNPKKGDEDIIDESIDANGWYGAVTAQKSTGYILAGNHRYRVAKKKGATEIPVIWRDVDDETALRILLVDNRAADRGTYDEALLEELLAGLETLDGTGYVLASTQEIADRNVADEVGARGRSDDEPPTADDVPADKYEPSFSVIILCKNERQQEETYRWLKEQLPKRDLRMTAV
jgi:ParB-like chromosome segregation protein Spo0J